MVSCEPLQIVRVYEIATAPTGEGTRFECTDGSSWRDVQPFEPPRGFRCGDYIYPGSNPPGREPG